MRTKRLTLLAISSIVVFCSTFLSAYSGAVKRNSSDIDTSKDTMETSESQTSIVFHANTGDIRVDLPVDLSAGDTLSGTVIDEPRGNTTEETEKNRAELQGYVVQADTNSTPARPGLFMWKIPATAAGVMTLILKDKDGREIARTEILSISVPPPQPEKIQLPTIGQVGRQLLIPGTFDGDYRTSRIKVGGQEVPVHCKSPRLLVVDNPSTTVGQTTLEVTERGSTVTGNFRNIALHLSAPKTTLVRGDKTVMTVEALGLSGLESPAHILLVNQSPGTVQMGSGDTEKELVFTPDQISSSGTCRTDIPIQSLQTGSFRIAANLITWPSFCPHKCSKDDPVPDPIVETAVTPTGYTAGEIDEMREGTKMISHAPVPKAGKAVAAAAGALTEAAIGFAEGLAKKNGVSLWVRLTCKRCELEPCLIWHRRNWVVHHSPWEKVNDFQEFNKNGGTTPGVSGETLSMAQIDEAISDKAKTLKCP